MRSFAGLTWVMVAAGCGGAAASSPPPATLRAVAPNELRGVSDFAVIPNAKARSTALFVEASRVLLHPRCANCHPSGDTPLQGDRAMSHDPPVARGSDDKGVVGLECTSCHQDRNLELARVPGAPGWHLAPRSMAWVGRSLHAICEQLKDPTRNGNKTLAAIVEHSAHDSLVGWAWNPGHGRAPAPGTQAAFGSLVAAWVNEGAECPPEEARR